MKNSVWFFGSFILVILGVFVYSAFYIPIVKSQNPMHESRIEKVQKSSNVNSEKNEIKIKLPSHKDTIQNTIRSDTDENIENEVLEDSSPIEQNVYSDTEEISYLSVSRDLIVGVKPSKSICLQYGGIIYNGDCISKYDDAQNICQEMDGVLPNIEQLINIVKKCGCNIDENDPPMCKNTENNNSYHSCYKDAGFTPFEYWSSTKSGEEVQMLVLRFYYGSVYGRYKNGYMGVRCFDGLIDE